MGKEYSFHRISLACLFLFGNISLFVPYNNAKNGEFSSLLIALTIGILFYFVWYFFADKIYTAESGKLLSNIFCGTAIVVCLLANAITVNNFINYISYDVLIKSLRISVVVAFLGICLYVISKTNEQIAKLSLLAFFFIISVIIILFAISFKNFEPVGLKELFCGKVVKRSGFYLYKAFWFPIVYALFSRFAYVDKNIKNDILGNVIGGVLIIVCFISAVLTFSLPFASKIDFAYPTSISVVNIGELYTRMDGYAYFIFFFSALVKSSVCGLTVKMLLKKMNVEKPYWITAILISSSFAISYLL